MSSGAEVNHRKTSNHNVFGNRGASVKGLRAYIAPIADGKIGKSRAVKVTWATLRSKLNTIGVLTSPGYIHNSPIRTLKDMTPEERAAIEERYGAKIMDVLVTTSVKT